MAARCSLTGPYSLIKLEHQCAVCHRDHVTMQRREASTITGDDVADWKGTRHHDEDRDLLSLDQPSCRTMSGNNGCGASLMRSTVGPIAVHER